MNCVLLDIRRVIALLALLGTPLVGQEILDGPSFLVGSERLDANLMPENPRGSAGGVVQMSFYYSSPEDNLPGNAQYDHLQGFSMVICYDCRLRCVEESFSIARPSIVTAIGVDFVAFQCENDDTDGDGCELLLAMLVEAAPPFKGQTLPPTTEPLRVATVNFVVDEAASCGDRLEIGFCNGANIGGKVPLHNVYSAENKSFPAATFGTEIIIDSSDVFRRGDCNFDEGFNISDPISVLNAVFFFDFYGFVPPCEDACDANDDGRLDLSDTMYLLQWLFLRGPQPPAPGIIERGVDPTDDMLQCSLTCD
jgi:hypothetical protein